MKTKRILSWMLAIMMIIGTMTFATVSSAAAEAWDGVTANEPAGSGTDADPYRVADGSNLAWISEQVKGGEDFAGKVFTQTADIDLGNKDFAPIGTTQIYDKDTNIYTRVAFKGTYDGMGYKISNGVIVAENKEAKLHDNPAATIYPTAVFGVIEDASISNIKFQNITSGGFNPEGSDDDEVFTTGYAAIAVGIAVKSKIDKITLDEDCFAAGVWYIGGVCAYAFPETVITRCENNGEIVGDYYVGGIVGCGCGIVIKYCVNNGTVRIFAHLQTITYLGGIIGGFEEGRAGGSDSISYCLNSEKAFLKVQYFRTDNAANRRDMVGFICGKEGWESDTYVFSYLYNLMTHIDVCDPVAKANGNATYNTLTGAILGQVTAIKDFATIDHCYSVKATRSVYYASDVTDDVEKQAAIEQDLLMGSTYPFAGLVNARGNAGSEAYWTPTTDTNGLPTSLYGEKNIRVEGEPDMAEWIKTTDAYKLLQDVLAIEVSGDIARAHTEVRYGGCQEKPVADGKVQIRLIGVADYTDFEEYGLKVTVTYAGEEAGETQKLAAEKLYKQILGAKKKYSAAYFGAERIYIINLELDATKVANLSVTPYFVKDGVENDGVNWTVSYNKGLFDVQAKNL